MLLRQTKYDTVKNYLINDFIMKEKNNKYFLIYTVLESLKFASFATENHFTIFFITKIFLE